MNDNLMNQEQFARWQASYSGCATERRNLHQNTLDSSRSNASNDWHTQKRSP